MGGDEGMKTDVWEEFRTPADLAPWKIHVVTELFPPMTKEDYSRLKEDIRKNGQRVPILLWNGMVVDGLNRLMVCRELKIKPVFQEWDGVGSLVDLVVSMNMSRRHMNPSQMAMVIARIRESERAESRARQLSALKKGQEKPSPSGPNETDGKSDPLWRRKMEESGVSETSVKRASAVMRSSREMELSVMKGDLTVGKAESLLKTLPEKTLLEIDKNPEVLKAVLSAKSCAKKEEGERDVFLKPEWERIPPGKNPIVQELETAAQESVAWIYTPNYRLSDGISLMKKHGFKYVRSIILVRKTEDPSAGSRIDFVLVGRRGVADCPETEEMIEMKDSRSWMEIIMTRKKLELTSCPG